MRSVADLPAPFGPTNPVAGPGRTWKARSDTAVWAPKDFVRPTTSIIGGGERGTAS